MWMTKVGWQLLFPRKTNWISENNKNAATFTVSSFLERNSESDPEPAERWVIRLCLLDLPWVNAGVHVTSGIGFLKWMLSAHCVCWWRKDLYPTDKHSPFIPALTGSSHQMSWSMGACFKTDCRRWTTVPSHWERELSLFALYQSKAHWRKKMDRMKRRNIYLSWWRSFQSYFMTIEAAESYGRLIYHNTHKLLCLMPCQSFKYSYLYIFWGLHAKQFFFPH